MTPSPRVSGGTCCRSSCTLATRMSPSKMHQESLVEVPVVDVTVGAACSLASTGSNMLSVSAGVSRRKWWTGSQTTVPARFSASMTTRGVSLRKSCGELSGPRADGGPSGTLYWDRASDTVQSVTCQP